MFVCVSIKGTKEKGKQGERENFSQANFPGAEGNIFAIIREIQ